MDLQQLHEEFGERGLVVLGFNAADEASRARALLAEKGATYRNAIDPSRAGQEVFMQAYRGTGVPLHYVIDREGRIADAWYGQQPDDRRVRAVLERLGVR